MAEFDADRDIIALLKRLGEAQSCAGQAEREVTRLTTRFDEPKRANDIAHMRIGILEVQVARMREATDQALAAIWDAHYGGGIAEEYARNVSESVSRALREG